MLGVVIVELTAMTFWIQVTATAIGAFFAFLFGLALFWIKERLISADRKKKAIKNLLYEFEYNLTWLNEYKKKINNCIEAVSTDKRNIYLNLDYGFVAVFFAKQFYNEGYLPDFLHQEEMRKWNIFLSSLSPGSEAYVEEEVDKWREKNGDKKSVSNALKNEMNDVQFAIDMIEYLKTKIVLNKEIAMSDNANNSEIAVYKTVNMQGQNALKASLLINGGASLALLAFISITMRQNTGNSPLLKLFSTMFQFNVATLLATMAFGATYLTGLVQSVAGSKKMLWFWFFNLSAIFMIIASYVLFFIGSLRVYFAFVEAFKM
jgi:hypothetical protein